MRCLQFLREGEMPLEFKWGNPWGVSLGVWDQMLKRLSVSGETG